jgi:DNA-binding FadR family transcriptional regulator
MMEQPEASEASVDILGRTIERLMERRKLGAGSKLPPERELATSLGLSRHAVRRALDVMEAQGKIWRHVGRGTFVGKGPAPDPGDIGSVLRHTSPREIVEARQMLEPQMAAAAAAHATPVQIAAIEDAYRRCAAARNMDTYEIWDEAFHRSIAAATGNMMLGALFEVLNKARKDVVWGTLRRAMLKPERREHYSGEHERVLEAIRNRDSSAAWTAMRGHIGTLVGVYSVVEDVRATGRGSLAF